LIWLIQWMSQPHEFGRALAHIIAALKANLGWQRTVVLAFYLLAGLMGWFALQSRTERLHSPGKPIQTSAEQLWFWSALISGVLLLAAGFILATYYNVDPGRIMVRVLRRNATPLLGAGIATFLCYALTAYVADVAVYVTADAKSKNYAARTAILKGSTQALVQLLTDQKYDRVILAGHSLGSVIAYDTINELLSQVNATPGPAADQPVPLLSAPELKKLKGLVTFGSPLDKIYYFFREHVKRDQAIRAQILSMLHSFRKLPSGRDYSPYEFNYSFRQLDDLIWLNAWARLDPVGAKLKFYALPDQDQQCFPYRVPVWAHLSYWADPNFYSFFGDRLL